MELGELRAHGLIELLDVELAEALCSMARSEDADVKLAVALTSRNVRRGHTCFRLATPPRDLWPREPDLDRTLPRPDEWEERLRATSLTKSGPLVLASEGRLYLRRYWQLEQDVARNLAERAEASPEIADDGWLGSALDRLFGEGESSPQRRAAQNALRHRVSLLCGGPGTGKTTTVASIVAMIVERDLHRHGAAPRVMLLAPTGKAAARLGEAVLGAKERIRASEEVLACIPTEASTVHRALGMQREGMRFRRSAELPLEADVIVLDEASMIDLALMRQLLDATSPTATLLIVGDPDQLTSVEAGSVLRDLVEANEKTWWRDRVTHLEKTWRYDETQPLGKLVRAIRQENEEAVDALLTSDEGPDVVWQPFDERSAELERAAEFWEQACATTDAVTHFALRNRFVMLTPFRRGPIGTSKLGDAIQDRLRSTGREPDVTPIIIEQNSHELKVYNGDFAMLVAGETPKAVVMSDRGDTREIAQARLPRYSDAFALSVHKSQGSEFEEVLIVLPEEDAPLLTRELLYTAVSRAKKRVRIVGPKEVVLAALRRRARRDSGLVEAIGEQTPR
jgi:exodeoxyribonuclease V alpha subunit